MLPLASALLLHSSALAGGRVYAIAEADASGRFHATDETKLAVRVRGAGEVPLERGMEVLDGDEIRCTRARVEIRLDDGGAMHLQEGTSATIGPASVLQTLGDLYYRVRGAFVVRYATVEAAVEGTRFRVAAEGPDAVRVEVDAGKVRVSNAGADVLVPHGSAVIVPLDGPPGELRRWARAERTEVWGGSWAIGRPRLRLGVAGGGGLERGGPSAGGRAFARVALAPPADLQVDLGATPAPDGGLFLPASATLAWAFQAAGADFGLGARGAAALELCDCGGGRDFLALHLGGTAVGRTSIPLARQWSLEAAVEVGYVGGVESTGWLGLGVGL